MKEMKELTAAKVMQLVNIAERLQLHVYGMQVTGLFTVFVVKPLGAPVDTNELVGPLTLEEAQQLNPDAILLVGSVIHEFLLALPGYIRHAGRQQKPE